jgi:hypothetical protein
LKLGYLYVCPRITPNSAAAFDRIWLRSTIPIIDDRFMLNGARQIIELEGPKKRGR